MAKKTINIGTSPNARDGDTLRAAFTKANENFTELYSAISGAVGSSTDIYKFQYGVIGTKDDPDTGGWGGSAIVLDPGGESWAGVYIPSVSAQESGASLNLYNNKGPNNSIQLSVSAGSFTFSGDGKLYYPDGSFSSTAFVGIAQSLINTGSTAVDRAANELAYFESRILLEDMFNALSLELGYPWGVTFPVSNLTYEELVNYSGVDPVPSVLMPTSMAARNAYLTWQESIVSTNITSGDQTISLGNDGKIVFPTLTVDLHNGGMQSGQVLQFADNTKQAIITGPTPAYGNSAERLIIQGQRATGEFAEGGDVYLWAGDSDSNGGDIKIYAGDADAVPGNGGYINIDAGNGYANGGNVTLTAGGSALQGGNVTITAGYASQGTPGYVNLTTSGGTVSLAADGSLNVPGKIVSTGHLELDANYAAGYSVYIGQNHPTAGMLGGVVLGDTRGGFVDIVTEKLLITNTAVPTHSTGVDGDIAGQVAFDNTHIYYCTANYNQLGHQVAIAADYLGRTSLNTNSFQLTKTVDTLQITAGDIISDSDGGATSVVVSVTSDADYTYVSTGGVAYSAIFPLTFTSQDYVPGGNIWKRVAWSNDTW